eukprot:TRINITY_DN5129_c0_g1_i1.p1 TRINITY_DN5129_c0_g1~~TRINITY_DN5129_c0_g1_i1.p1  ORF type:complete len:317 (-),score=38.60 TRINITY_DN5129_c0_g1_i1:175-1125(-)
MGSISISNPDYGLEVLGPNLISLLSSEKLTDLCFITMDPSGKESSTTWNAHSCLFAWKSPFLRDLIEETREYQLNSDSVVLTLPNTRPSTVKALIEYFYKGWTNTEDKKELVDLCELLGIVDVDLDENELEYCSIEHIKVDNFENNNDEFSVSMEAFSPSVSLLLNGSSSAPSQNKSSPKPNKTPSVPQPKKCNLCNVKFPSKACFRRHRKACESKLLVPKKKNIKDQPSAPFVKKSLKCSFCDVTYLKLSNLKNHTLNHFKSILYPKLPSCKPYTCPDCSKVSRDRVTLLRHYSFFHQHIFEHISQKKLYGQPTK